MTLVISIPLGRLRQALRYHRRVRERPGKRLPAAGSDDVLSGEGLLMPARKDQAPDLRYFKQTRK
jgi:hypothetical protein